MHSSTLVSGALLLLTAAVADARSWQHVGRKAPIAAPAGDSFVSHYLAARDEANTTTKYLNSNTTRECLTLACFMRSMR